MLKVFQTFGLDFCSRSGSSYNERPKQKLKTPNMVKPVACLTERVLIVGR